MMDSSLSLSSLMSRILAVFILLLCLAIIVFGVFEPIYSRLYERHEDIDQARLALGKYENVNATKAQAEIRYQQLNNTLLNRGEFLNDKTVSLAGANLPSRLRRISSTSGIKISSIKSLPAEPSVTANIVTLKVKASGDMGSMMTTLHKLETSIPYMMIDDFSLKPTRVQRSANNIDVEAEFNIYAFLSNDPE